MNTRRSARGPALGGLRRLPRRLTAWWCVLNAAGLIVLAVLLVHADEQRSVLRMDGELRRVTSSVLRLVDNDVAVVTAYVDRDPLSTGCPQFAILPGRTSQFREYVSRQDCVPVDRAVLAGVAADAVAAGTVVTAYLPGPDGRRLRICVEPFRNREGQFVAAVVAVMDSAPELSRHRRLTRYVILGCLLGVVAAGAAGYALTTRATGPAVIALRQQETLLADTAHDLRTPVAGLRALAEAALANPAQRTELLPRAVDLAERMGSIIDGVLMRARLAAGVEPLDIQPVWLDQLVSAVVEETPAHGATVTVTTAPTKVDADPALVQRAIGNLLDNALRHGRVPGQDALVHITVAGGRVIVADHGPGIDAAAARETFDRFKSTGGSSGLGLSIVRWVAQAHGGMLRVYNAEEGGAIFELVLPLSDA